MEFITLLIGLILGGIGVYLSFRKTLINKIQQDKETEAHNRQLSIRKNKLTQEVDFLTFKKEQTTQEIQTLKNQAEQAGEELYSKNIELAQVKFEKESERLSQELQNSKKEYEEEYLSAMKDISKTFNDYIEENNIILKNLENRIKQRQEEYNNSAAIAAAAVEANIRANEEYDKKLFYSLQISEEQLNDVEKLREVSKILKNDEPLNKVIWKTYYEKPFTDLIGRILGDTTNPHIGIYKITNKENSMCYIGQSVNLADRLRAHIKAGLGIDGSNNKLYTAMKQFKVENFTYEIIEECKREELNDKERMWIKYFHSEKYGYNMTKGNN